MIFDIEDVNKIISKNYKEYSTFHFPLTYQFLYTWKNFLGKDLDSNLIFPAFVVGVYSISLSNHGLGVYPLAISLFLVNFGVNTEVGLTYGWLAWSCQAIITLIFGALSFFVLPLLYASD